MIVRRVDKGSVTSVEGYDTLAETSIGEDQEVETDNESIKSRLYIKPVRKWLKSFDLQKRPSNLCL